MVKTYSNGNKIYSVDMMFTYLNLFKHPVTTIDVIEYSDILYQKGWGDPVKKIYYSPMDVLKNPTKKLYKNEMKRIKNADLSYPIIIHNEYIVDGLHRLTKAIIGNKDKLGAYIFNDSLMKKFLINDKRKWESVDKMGISDFIEKFHKEFCKGKKFKKN